MKLLPGFLAFSLLIFFVSCKEKTPPGKASNETLICGTKDPVNDLKWLNNAYKLFLGGPEINGILLYEYKGRQVARHSAY